MTSSSFISELSVFIRLIWQSDILSLLLMTLIFEIPRYLMTMIAIAFVGFPKPARNENKIAKISVIIASHNGAASLPKCIDGIRRQTIAPIEIIVVDDGSLDDTKDVACRAFEQNHISAVYRHGTRCGKSASVNHGLRFAKGDLILVVDDDTVLDRNGMSEIANVFLDPRVAAAGGNLGIRHNNNSICSSLQAIEYLTSITAGRYFLDLVDSISCCSGAFQMFRRDVLAAVGGMNVGGGEDLEITLRLRKLGYLVRFVPNAFATVSGPVTFGSLVRQRLRWDRDALAIRIFMYRGFNLRQPREGLSDTFQRLDFLIFEFFPTLVFPLYLVFIYAMFGEYAIAYLAGIYLFLLILALMNIGIVVMTTDNNLNIFDLIVTLIFPLYQGIVMKLVRFIAFSGELMFAKSRDDEYVPPRVRIALYGRGKRHETPPA